MPLIPRALFTHPFFTQVGREITGFQIRQATRDPLTRQELNLFRVRSRFQKLQ
ncbi:MAG: hypothetical protein Fues2KO_04660 [Fuerstiella sp.]